VKAGLAWHFKKYSDEQLLADVEKEARARKIGIWSVHKPMSPWEFRESQRRGSAVPVSEGIVYHGNMKSRVFHHSGCQHYNCKNCIKIFKTRDEALKAGYRPCGRCKP